MKFQILYYYCLLHMTAPCLASHENKIKTILKQSPSSIAARSSDDNVQQQSFRLRMAPAQVTASNSILMSLRDLRSRPELDKKLEELFSVKKEEKQEEEA